MPQDLFVEGPQSLLNSQTHFSLPEKIVSRRTALQVVNSKRRGRQMEPETCLRTAVVNLEMKTEPNFKTRQLVNSTLTCNPDFAKINHKDLDLNQKNE